MLLLKLVPSEPHCRCEFEYMARATQTRQDSTAEVIGILNDARASSTATPGKGKRKTGQAAPRPVGRPPKRPKVADNAAATADSADATATSTVGESSDKAPEAKGGTKLRNPKDRTGSRRRTTKMGRDRDVFATSLSPESASLATKRHTRGDTSGFDLEHNAFDAVPSGKEDEVDFDRSTSRNAKGQFKRVNATEQTSPRFARPVMHNVRILRSNDAMRSSEGDMSLEATVESKLPLRNPKTGIQQKLNSVPRALVTARTESANLGYPSPEQTLQTKPTRAKGASRSSVAPSSERLAVKKHQRLPEQGASHQSKEDSAPSEPNRSEDDEPGSDGEVEPSSEEEVEDQEDQEGNPEEDGQQQPGNADQQETRAEGNEADGPAADTTAHQSETAKRKGRFATAAELYDCGHCWKEAWTAAKQNRERSDPKSRPVRELAAAIQRFTHRLQGKPTVTAEREEGSVSDLEESDLEKIATLMGNLKPSDNISRQAEKRRKRDIHLQAIPRGVELARSILIVRSASGRLDMSALEELLLILKAVRLLCQRVYHWKPPIQFAEPVQSRTNREIKVSLKFIEDAYQVAVMKLRNAQQQEDAKLREKAFQQKQAELQEAKRRAMLESRRRMDEWAQGAGSSRGRGLLSTQQTRESSVSLDSDDSLDDVDSAEDVYDVEDVDEMDLYDSTPQPIGSFQPETTEEIQGPTKRIWREEETLALLLLLQRHRGPDRYERIQETISEIARDIRKLGPAKLLSMTSNDFFHVDLDNARDVLDDLGNMEVADIRHQARYLKAAQAGKMTADIRATGDSEKWRWLSSV